MSVCKFCGYDRLTWKKDIKDKWFLEEPMGTKHLCDTSKKENRVYITIPANTDFKLLTRSESDIKRPQRIYMGAPNDVVGITSIDKPATYTDLEVLTVDSENVILVLGNADPVTGTVMLAEVPKKTIHLENADRCLHIHAKRWHRHTCELCGNKM